ncbi:MAG TPA: hypothetical protein H9765_13410, partial [Candidatus Mediterraneibacter intestinigallinarum]|nr:hypothetical protein [Candidatus Mediterraneibacter intestinigallinarum]
MVSREKKSISIKKFKKKRELNLGIFLFAIVFIYLVVTVILYFTRGSISVYEVREGSIVRDNSYTGLIIRQETTVNAEESGYVSYFQNGNSKIKAGTNIYAISQEPLDTESVSDEEENSGRISEEVQSAIALQLQNFNENYDSNDFTSVYSLKNEISSALQNAYSETRMEHLGAVIAASSLDVNTYRSTQDGIIAFTVDGYESLTKDTFLAENFDNTA